MIDPRDAAWLAVDRVQRGRADLIEVAIFRLATRLAERLQKEQDKGLKQFYDPIP